MSSASFAEPTSLSYGPGSLSATLPGRDGRGAGATAPPASRGKFREGKIPALSVSRWEPEIDFWFIFF